MNIFDGDTSGCLCMVDGAASFVSSFSSSSSGMTIQINSHGYANSMSVGLPSGGAVGLDRALLSTIKTRWDWGEGGLGKETDGMKSEDALCHNTFLSAQ